MAKRPCRSDGVSLLRLGGANGHVTSILMERPTGEVLSLRARSQPGTEASNSHLKEPRWMWSFSLPVVSDSLRPYGLQHAKLLCPSFFLEFAQTHAHLDTAPRAIFSRGGPARISGQHGSVGWFVTRHLTISTVTGGSKARAGHAPSRSSIRCYVSPQTLILLFRICWGKKGVIELAIPVL